MPNQPETVLAFKRCHQTSKDPRCTRFPAGAPELIQDGINEKHGPVPVPFSEQLMYGAGNPVTFGSLCARWEKGKVVICVHVRISDQLSKSQDGQW
jgi:hypothetical protein